MISRREALKLGAAGLVAPSVGLAAGAAIPAMAQETGGSVPMFRGNAARTGEMPGPAPSLDYPIIVKWKFTTDYGIAAPPVISNQTVFIGSGDGNFYSLNAVTGEEQWRFPTGGGIRSSAVIAGDSIYFGSRDHNVYAVDAASGEEKWRYSTGEEVSGWPAVSNDIVYIGSRSGLYALDTTTGQEYWRITDFQPDQTPAFTDGMLFIGGGNLKALDAMTGETRWEFTVPDSYISQSSPAVADGVVYACSGDSYWGDRGIIHAINVSSGVEIWRFTTYLGSGFTSPSPAVVDGVVYASGPDGWGLHALEATTGHALWSIERGDTPYVTDDTVFFRSDTTSLLHAINAASGVELWSFLLGSGSEPVIVNGKIYITEHSFNDDAFVGSLYALGNLAPPQLVSDTTIRGAPSTSSVERDNAVFGTEIDNIGQLEEREGQTWVEVTIDDVTGWIPLDAIDPATLPPEGEIEYVYVPD